MYSVALLSVHGCPVSRLGEKDTGGMNVYLLQVAKELGKLGVKVDIFTRYHDRNDPQVIKLGENARTVHLKAGPYDQEKDGLHQHIPEFLDSLYEFQRSEGLRYDIVHSHYWLSGSVGRKLSLEWNIPHVAMFHTLGKSKMQARYGERESDIRISTEGRVIESADVIVASTEQERGDLSRLYGAAVDRVRVIPAGVDTELFRPLDKVIAREDLGIKESHVILSVGRIEALKGLDILITALADLEDNNDVRLLIVGGEPRRDSYVHSLMSLVRELGLMNKVTFIGAIPQNELPKYYSAADVFVLSSYYETFGLVALEAMACGLPVVASRLGGPNSFVESGKNGYLVPWQCPEPYAQRIGILLAIPTLRVSMGAAARVKAESMTWSQVARSTVGVYHSILARSHQSALGA